MYKSKKNYLKGKNGITLIALVITIIVLIILAGISINLVLGENGIIQKAKQTSVAQTEAEVKEEVEMILAEYAMQTELNNKTLIAFLEEKVLKRELDDKEELDDGKIEIFKSGYSIVIDKEGNIVEEIKKIGPKPQISNIRVELQDGTTDIPDNSLEIGTIVKINFDAFIENGEIISIEPSLPYTTNGEELEKQFEIIGKVNGVEYKRRFQISLKNKYEIIYEADSLLNAMEMHDFEDGKYKIKVNDEIYNLRVYAYNENLQISQDSSFGQEDDVATENEYAKNMVVLRVDGNLTIDEGIKLTAYASTDGYGGPKGMMIYCTGTLENNGEISMTARGAKAEGQNVYLWKNADNSYEYVPAVGMTGAEAAKIVITKDYQGSVIGISGDNASNRMTGGGGSGAVRINMSLSRKNGTYTSGIGSSGTSYSGGSGGGVANGYAYGCKSYGENATANGGKGGRGMYNDGALGTAAGGAGNPGAAISGENGTGGLLIIYAKNIYNKSLISSNGSVGGSYKHTGAGGSGGGSINIFYKNTYENNGNITVTGGAGGTGSEKNGGAGGTGSISVGNISTGTYQSTEKNY